MLGYIEPEKSQLRLWEYEQYRAAYCGLCRSMGRHTGSLSRLTLNYDYVFLAMIRTGLLGIKPDIVPSRCAVHPTKKRAISKDDKALEYCAEIAAILAYHKLRDDVADSRGAKKLFARLLVLPTRSFAKKCSDIKDCANKTAEYLKELSALEKQTDVTCDMLAEVFGKLLGEIFAFGLEDEKAKRIAFEIGRHTGRYIYIADALDDYEKDVKSKEFNPFVCMYGTGGLLSERGIVKNSILLELKSLETAISLIDFSNAPGYGNVVYNIIYLGMPDKIDKIFDRIKTFENGVASENEQQDN